MKTNKLPQPALSGSQAAGSQSHQNNQAQTRYLSSDADEQTDQASNDADYAHDPERAYIRHSYERDNKATTMNDKSAANNSAINSAYKKASVAPTDEYLSFVSDNTPEPEHSAEPYAHAKLRQCMADKPAVDNHTAQHSRRRNAQISSSFPERDIPERIFMNTLIKHTAIALAIIVPLAAFSAYAAPMPAMTMSADNGENSHTAADTLAVTPSDIIHNVASEPTTVDGVDLDQYAGTWYEIGRLPMRFQRNCARDVTATYTQQTDGSGIDVLNQCVGEDGKSITADGVATTADDSGSKLKVTFLPSWLRWLPIGRANYWVLARDDQYNTALVGTPDHKYLWLLARTPDIRQDTYAKYRQIAQQQGYDLKEFNLTVQTGQTANLVP